MQERRGNNNNQRKEETESTTSSLSQPQPQPPPTILIVGVSGGCDSMGLLHAILDISTAVDVDAVVVPPDDDDDDDRHDNSSSNQHVGGEGAGEGVRRFRDGQVIELHVVHFNHCQRGIESDLDCQLVQDLCQKEGVFFHVYTWEQNEEQEDDNNKEDHEKNRQRLQQQRTTTTATATTTTDNKNKKKKSFSQAKARRWRQSTMTKLLQELTAEQANKNNKNNNMKKRPGLILTAHHANDSQETLLLKLLRGVHVQNLSGMAQIQPMEEEASNNNNNKPIASGTIWARPLLHLTKDEIRHYLVSQNYSWREDSSNQSSKYLRNRVRNELIPLMEELVGGETALQKRLYNLQEQCSDIRNDITKRTETIQDAHVDQENRFLLLLRNNNNNFHDVEDLVARHALYDWANAATKKHQIPYDLWKNVLAQLRDYPRNRQWTLPLGEGWHIVRLGDALQVVFDENMEQQGGNNNTGAVPLTAAAAAAATTKPKETVVPWSCCHDDTSKSFGNDSTDFGLLVVNPPPPFRIARQNNLDFDDDNDNDDASSFLEFVQSTTGAANALSWKFTPPWREGRSPTKLGSFLRGQKVPLHLRSTIPIIVCRRRSGSRRQCDDGNDHDNHDAVDAEAEQTTTTATVVAVLVQHKWIVDSAWKTKKDGSYSIALTLHR